MCVRVRYKVGSYACVRVHDCVCACLRLVCLCVCKCSASATIDNSPSSHPSLQGGDCDSTDM